MIVQTAIPGQPHLVIRQADHARMSGQFAAHFGNERFAGLDPHAEMIYVAAHHDEGWVDIDARAAPDPRTGLPQHLTQTRLVDLIATGPASPTFNERHHPYCGILSSMHTWGLYHGRYGLSDKIFIDTVTDEFKPLAKTMLDSELARQNRLIQWLVQDPAWAARVVRDALFRNYKLLQFFDTLALYFHLTHAAARGESSFRNVPMSADADAVITARPVSLADGTYAVDPFPFNAPFEAHYDARPLSPAPPGADLARTLGEARPVRERVTLVPAA